jgi:hypothetical protein
MLPYLALATRGRLTDVIIVLKEGTVIKQCTHEELCGQVVSTILCGRNRLRIPSLVISSLVSDSLTLTWEGSKAHQLALIQLL